MSVFQGFKVQPGPCTLTGYGVRLEPLTLAHTEALSAAARDGALWNLRVTSVPEPEQTATYIQTALEGLAAGHRVPFVVIDETSAKVIGCTSYHDILAPVARLEIGFTWYAKSYQRTHVNTACKLMLLEHAFGTLGAAVVGWRTDNFNYASRRAIERLGAKLDGIIRHHALRRDGTVRDTVMYSVIAGDWPEIQAHLLSQLKHHAA
jgi:RimJ/RimL family protein N-acetyltransferase